MINIVKPVYQNDVKSRLSNLVSVTKKEWNNNKEFDIVSMEMTIEFIKITNFSSEQEIQYSQNIESIVPLSIAMNLINKLPNKPGSESNIISNSKHGDIYYSYEISNEDNFIILFSDDQLTNALINDISFKIIYVFIATALLTAVIIIIWSNLLTNRIHRIQNHIDNLPYNNFEKEYIDKGKDEISTLNKSLNEFRIALMQTELAKREMLQNISHDFKTPIAVIKSYVEAIKDGLSDDDTLDVILKQTDLLQDKVTKLLLYNKIEYLNKDKPFEYIKMKEIIDQIVTTYKYKTDLNFEINLDNSNFRGYYENFYTVIDNIIDNAQRYAKTCIKINLNKGILSIFNDGEPIDEKFTNGLFKPYEKGSKGQFGLGMSIVKKTLDFLDMDLAVKNLNNGVVFVIKQRKMQ
ncbi:MAG: sensor histidine kinase [Anaeroplasmataceae bacterium]